MCKQRRRNSIVSSTFYFIGDIINTMEQFFFQFRVIIFIYKRPIVLFAGKYINELNLP